MVRTTESALCHGVFVLILVLGGCVNTPEKPATEIESAEAEEVENESKPSGLLGAIFGNKKEKKIGEPESQKTGRSQPTPRKIPMGTIHLVHQQGGFVLIEAVQMRQIPHDAELMTYSAEGRPTGKLRISPEHKGNFRVADIVAGNPQSGDRVMLFGIESTGGELMFGSDPAPNVPEVLE